MFSAKHKFRLFQKISFPDQSKLMEAQRFADFIHCARAGIAKMKRFLESKKALLTAPQADQKHIAVCCEIMIGANKDHKFSPEKHFRTLQYVSFHTFLFFSTVSLVLWLVLVLPSLTFYLAHVCFLFFLLVLSYMRKIGRHHLTCFGWSSSLTLTFSLRSSTRTSLIVNVIIKMQPPDALLVRTV